jgi:hypothetical protein
MTTIGTTTPTIAGGPTAGDTISIVSGSASKTTTVPKHGWISQRVFFFFSFFFLPLPANPPFLEQP